MDEIYNMYEKLNIETNIVDVMYNKILNPNLTYAKLLNDSEVWHKLFHFVILFIFLYYF